MRITIIHVFSFLDFVDLHEGIDLVKKERMRVAKGTLA